MDPIDNAFYDEIIYEDYRDSASDDENESENCDKNKNDKENKKRITSSQIKKLISTMDGRNDCISKGKLKSDKKTVELLLEWDELAKDLNALGPPQHTNSEWRRIWTKMKSTKKRKRSAGVLCNQNQNNKKVKHKQHKFADNNCDENDIVEPVDYENHRNRKSCDRNVVKSTVEPIDSQNQCDREWSVRNTVTNTVEPVNSVGPLVSEKLCLHSHGSSVETFVEPADSEPDQQVNIQRELSRIVNAITTLSEIHKAEYELMNKKLDDLTNKQDNMNKTLNVLTVFGIDINAFESNETSHE